MTDTPRTETGELSDEACMTALQQGDDTALAPLMQRWELPVKAFVSRLGVPFSDVEDVAQEAFVRLYENRARYRAGAAFKPWLLTIAGNLARNRLRWRSRHPADSWDALVETTGREPVHSDANMQVASAADAVALAADVRKAVAALPEPLREAVVCVELEDMSYVDAARVMECSPKAVETRGCHRPASGLRRYCRGKLRTAPHTRAFHSPHWA